jgi:ribonucleoside-triphosphate reductase
MHNQKEFFCHDCNKKAEIEAEEAKNGVFLTYDNAGTKINVFKCTECYEKNKSLTNYQECEVYSRVVGYIRPVQQWHKGKKEEYEERKEFSMPESCCDFN